jgi:hypothetical protein
VAVPAAGIPLVDLLLARLVEQKASHYVSRPLGDEARIRLHGRSLLAQMLRGRYGDIEVSSSGLRVGVFGGTTLTAHLINARLPLRALLRRKVSELPVDHVYGDLVIPYAELARLSPLPGLRISFREERLVAVAAVAVPGGGSLADVTGEAVVRIGKAGRPWLRVRDLSLAGAPLPKFLVDQLVPMLSFRIPLPRLPYGLRIDQVTASADGLRISLSTRDVVFRNYWDPDA